MYGRIIKVTIICLLLVGLGISFRPMLKRGTLSCSAADVKKEADAPEVPIAAPPAPVAGKYDFSDSSHWNLTVSAWESLAQKDFEGVSAYANKCLELYEPKAKEMALGMKSFSRSGHEDDFALVNDVATSHYIMGEAYMKLERPDDAVKEFTYIIETYPYAQCWDPKGWFWKVAEVSRKNIEKIGKSGPQPAPEIPK
jgi:hypothetical protein